MNDPRGELWQHTSQAREAKGPTYRFSPTQKESCAFNVLDAVRWGEDEAYGDVARVVHGMLAPAPGEELDAFRMEAEPLLVAIAFDGHVAGEANFPAVLRWMTEPSRSMQDKAKELVRSPIPVVSAGGRRLLDKSDRLQAAVWSAALSALSIYQDPVVAAHTSHSDVDVSDLQQSTRPVSIFMTPPFADVARLRPLLGTITDAVIARCSAQQGTPRQRVLLALDELANLGRLDELERGMSFLQGCGVQVLAVLQNLRQFTFTYGPHSPLLASIGTSVWYTPTPTDRETANYLSEQLGVMTARLFPETQHLDFWGFRQGRSVGTTEHARPLLTSDEVRRLDDQAAVVLTKGCAPILGRKLGSPAPEVIDLSPTLKKVAAIAAAVVLTGSVAVYALWPSPTPPPSLSLATETTPTA